MTGVVKPLCLFETEKNLFDGVSNIEDDLFLKYKDVIQEDPSLSRRIVSFQANKNEPGYRWYKFKEAFSSQLVNSLLERFNIQKGNILDPFAGSGTTLFAASDHGINADGIELLPLAQEIISTRVDLLSTLEKFESDEIMSWLKLKEWEGQIPADPLPFIRITNNAYPDETKRQIENYLTLIKNFNRTQQQLLSFALLCILERISYTRKDGQYLRWDYRAKRTTGSKKKFDKGEIPSFTTAIQNKVDEIVNDLRTIDEVNLTKERGQIRLFKGSNLEKLSEFQENSYDAIITSPPYCNRYDYTRTYALELALLGLNDQAVINLRQEMLSSTVENRRKALLAMNSRWKNAILAFENQELIQDIIKQLEALKASGQINNSGIPRMVRGYFEEMSCIIYECYRVLKPNAVMIVVNDNVRYEGISIPVDLILSNIAEQLGFSVENILVLQDRKGNSSQQMGKLGKDSLRKCVYIWRKLNHEKSLS